MRLFPAVLLFVVLFSVACGSRTDRSGSSFLQQQLVELERLPKPVNLAQAKWDDLKSTLRTLIEERIASGRTTSGAPDSNGSKAQLAFEGGTGTLSWGYYNVGDYDQNSEVNVADLSALGAHLLESVPADPNSSLAVIDGDGNGEINVADLTPLGANLGNRVSAYNVYSSQDAGDYPASNTEPSSVIPIGTLQFSAATGDKTTQRLQFAFTVPAPAPGDIYWVRPEDGSGDGTPSNMSGPAAPIQSSIEVFQLTLENADGTVYENTDWGQADVTFVDVPETLYFSMTFNGTEVISNAPLDGDGGALGQEQTVGIRFDLGVASGTPVTDALVSYTLEKTPKTTSSARHASDESSLSVTPKVSWNPLTGDLYSQFDTPPIKSENPVPLGQDSVFDTAQHQQNFMATVVPAQSLTEVAPASVASSLRYLDRRFSLGLEDTSLPTMINACGKVTFPTSPAGQNDGTPLDWPKRKNNYMKANGYPIVTSVTRSVDEAFAALQQDYDVELVIDVPEQGPVSPDHHQWTFAIVSMARYVSGRVGVEVADMWGKGKVQLRREWLERYNPIGYNGTRELTCWGQGQCYYVIEKPKPAQTGWNDRSMFEYSLGRHDAYVGMDQAIHTVGYNFLAQEFQANTVVGTGDLMLQQPGMTLAQSDGFDPDVAVAEVNDSLGAVCIEDHGDQHTVVYHHMKADGTLAEPVVLADDPAGDPIVFMNSPDIIFDGVPKVCWVQDGDVMLAQGLDMDGTGFTTPVAVSGAFCNRELECDLGQNPLLAWDNSGEVHVVPDIDFTTGLGAAEEIIGTDTIHFELKVIDGKFFLEMVGPGTGVQIRFSTDGTGMTWNPFQIVIPPPLSIDTLIGLGPSADGGVGLAVLDPNDAGLKYFGGTPQDNGTIQMTLPPETLADIFPPYYGWDLEVFEDGTNTIVAAPDASKINQDYYYCECGK